MSEWAACAKRCVPFLVVLLAPPVFWFVRHFTHTPLVETYAASLEYVSVDVDAYYMSAEYHMSKQWKTDIWPRIQRANFESVVEIAAGWGRNTNRLLEHASTLVATDINSRSIAHMRGRFANHSAVMEGRARFFVNNGTSLPMVSDGSATLVYSWDAMVHFPAPVIGSYVGEIARMLAPGGTTFLHHSALRMCAGDPVTKLLPEEGHSHPGACGVRDITKNPESRSVASVAGYLSMKDFVAETARLHGLEIVRQDDFPWSHIHKGAYQGPAVHDCISILRKPDSKSKRRRRRKPKGHGRSNAH